MDSLYDRGRSALLRARASASFAETHGVLCGTLCTPGGADTGGWLEDLLADPEVDAQALDACRALLGECLARSARELGEGEFAFAPLLPDDDEPLDDRCVALGEWCSGYLYGLGAGGIGEGSGLAAEVREALDDLARLARLSDGSAEAEGDEEDYAELVEFVRVAVMSVYEDQVAAPRGRA